MAEMSLPDIFNDCIDRLAAGQSLDACLRAYPGQASRLRSMLESGLVAARVAYPAAEVMLAQERIWSRMEQAYLAPSPVRPMRLPRRWQWAIAAAAALLMMTGVMLAAQNSQPGDPLYGVKVFIQSIFPGQQPAPLPTPTETAVPTAATTTAPTATPTVESTATATSSATPTPDMTTTSQTVTTVIEGPVEAINGNVITIYGIHIEISDDDPMLDVIEVGDVIHVEGDIDDVTIAASDITVVGAEDEIFTNDSGEVWRDDGTCSNPPPDWAPANGWRRRCEGGNGNVAPGSLGQGNGNTNGNANGNSGGMGMGSGSGS
jgi:hypothetical protein